MIKWHLMTECHQVPLSSRVAPVSFSKNHTTNQIIYVKVTAFFFFKITIAPLFNFLKGYQLHLTKSCHIAGLAADVEPT